MPSRFHFPDRRLAWNRNGVPFFHFQPYYLEDPFTKTFQVIKVRRRSLSFPGILPEGPRDVKAQMQVLTIITYSTGSIRLAKLKELETGALPVQIPGNGLQPGLQQGWAHNIQFGAETIDHFHSSLQLFRAEIGAVGRRVREYLFESIPYEIPCARATTPLLRSVLFNTRTHPL